MKVIGLTLLDKVSSEAKESPRLRINYNFHLSLDDKCHRFLNAVEPGTEVPNLITSHPKEHPQYIEKRKKKLHEYGNMNLLVLVVTSFEVLL